MTNNKKPATTGAVTGSKNTTADALNSTAPAHKLGSYALPMPGSHPTGWRGALASGNSHFRKYGAHDSVATGRALRRAQAKALRKAQKQVMKKGGK